MEVKIDSFAEQFEPPRTWDEAIMLRANLISSVQHIQAQLARRNQEASKQHQGSRDYKEWRPKAVHAVHIHQSHIRQLKAWFALNRHLDPTVVDRETVVAPDDELGKAINLFAAARHQLKRQERIIAALSAAVRQLGGDPDWIMSHGAGGDDDRRETGGTGHAAARRPA
jgi:hypothetical protein